MVDIYLQKDSVCEYFINSLRDSDLHILSCKEIKENAFFDVNCVDRLNITNGIAKIELKAFCDCSELKFFLCGTLNNSRDSVQNIHGFCCSSCDSDFEIQAFAFKNCEKLETIILPEISKDNRLIIEKGAFSNCSSLRTFVCLCSNISFTGNPFEDSNENLTFIGRENSDLERFARENNYRYINAE